MKLSFGYSPCPNDTFIFHAIANKKIDLKGIDFDIELLDVEELNKFAIQGKFDLTKLSYFAYFKVYENYQLLSNGGAMGSNCGPLLICKVDNKNKAIKKLRIGIPGKNTTAYFLLQEAYPEIKNVEEILFSEIEDAILDDKIDAGLIIHENRFTYHKKGLEKIADLGEIWENKTGFPIPLGGIAVKRNYKDDIKSLVAEIIRDSILYAYNNIEDTMGYVRSNAQSMQDSVMKEHIDLYVNGFTKNIGVAGEDAITYMASKVLMNSNESVPLIFSNE